MEDAIVFLERLDVRQLAMLAGRRRASEKAMIRLGFSD